MNGAALAALGALVALTVPSAALAQYMGNTGDAALQDPRQRYLAPPEPDPGWPAMPGNAVHGELGAALESVNAIIRAHAGGDYSAPDYPFVRAEADTDNGRLVVVMHSMAHLAGMEYGVDEMQEALATGVDIEVTYDAFESGIWVPGGSRESRVALETRYYLDSCLPVPGPGFRAACVEYAGHLGGGDSPWLPGAHPPLHSLFFDDFESGLEATWIKDGTGWAVGRPDDDTGRAGGTTPDLVARPGMCSDECAITQRIPVYLPDHSSPELVFRVNVGAWERRAGSIRQAGTQCQAGEYQSCGI